MARDPSRTSGVHAVDDVNRVWCPASARDVHVERCMTCGRLTGMHERDGVMFVMCRDGSGDRRASTSRDPAAMRWR